MLHGTIKGERNVIPTDINLVKEIFYVEVWDVTLNSMFAIIMRDRKTEYYFRDSDTGEITVESDEFINVANIIPNAKLSVDNMDGLQLYYEGATLTWVEPPEELPDLGGEQGQGQGVDYIIEQGTKDIWFYRKWKSGLMELFCNVDTSTFNKTITGTKVAEKAVFFPFEFAERPVVLSGAPTTQSSAFYGVTTVRATNLTGQGCYITHSDGALANIYCCLCFVGKYKQ